MRLSPWLKTLSRRFLADCFTQRHARAQSRFLLSPVGIEFLEDRTLPSAPISNINPTPMTATNATQEFAITGLQLPGLHLVDASANRFDGQIIFLDFDGAENVTYHGPVTVGPFDFPAFKAPARMEGQEQPIKSQVLNEVQAIFADTGVKFTLNHPEEGAVYSTVFVGCDDAAFRSYGRFNGLAEGVDVGNHSHTDSAIVFSSDFGDITQLSQVIEHEAGHLLGYAHTVELGSGILASVAATLPWGTTLGSFNGVTNYSNDPATMPSPQPRNTSAGVDTGLKWECVEYVNRYYYVHYGLNLGTGQNAWPFYGNALARGLTAYANGGTTVPQVGDILCFNQTGSGLGHVAIIRAVDQANSVVHVIQQNVKNGGSSTNGFGTDDDWMFAYRVSGGNYRSSKCRLIRYIVSTINTAMGG